MSQSGQYPPGSGGYPPQQGDYPPQQGGYPPDGSGHYAPPGYPAGAADPGYQKMSSTNPMNLIWFAASVCVLVGALIAFIAELFEFQIVDALEMVYLFGFACVLAVL